jgi:hypothetical protein
MKFGKQYDFHKIPEWSEHYLDYEYLKKILKATAQQFRGGTLYDYLGNKIPKRKNTTDLDIGDVKITSSTLHDVLISDIPVMRSYSTDIKIEGSINEITSDRIGAKISDDLQNHINSQEVINFELQKFNNDYLEKLTTVEDFFKTKLDELFSEFDKLRKKMSNKKLIVQYDA